MWGLWVPKTGLNGPQARVRKQTSQNRLLRTWFKCFCRITIFYDRTRCPHSRYSVRLEKFGDHLFHCTNGLAFCRAPPIHRSDFQVRLLAADLTKASWKPIMEPPGSGNSSSANISAFGTSGSTDLLDETVGHPLATIGLTSALFNTQVLHNQAFDDKKRKHGSFTWPFGADGNLCPLKGPFPGPGRPSLGSISPRWPKKSLYRSPLPETLLQRFSFSCMPHPWYGVTRAASRKRSPSRSSHCMPMSVLFWFYCVSSPVRSPSSELPGEPPSVVTTP